MALPALHPVAVVEYFTLVLVQTPDGFGKQPENPTWQSSPRAAQTSCAPREAKHSVIFGRTGGKGGALACPPVLPPAPQLLMHPRCAWQRATG